jgi:hypothetical protein
MIVRDRGDSWQVVLQTDHADLSGDMARLWADRGPRHESLELATRRHDDGWAVWEQSPLVDGAGAPVAFLDVDVRSHLAFYRAAIASIAEEDAYAGLLVSMHGAGIYRQRYGRDPGLALSRAADAQELVDAFVEEQESGYEARMRAAGVDEQLRWADYTRLQHYDRFSLAFQLRDMEHGEPVEIAEYRFEPLGAWHVRVDPYPFVESPARFSLLRRVIPRRPWTQAEFRQAFWTFAPERLDITIEAPA